MLTGNKDQILVQINSHIQHSKGLPFVVLPHGGPHARDFLRFDWLVQLVVSQGFGVLQMNYRWSTGYGREFYEAGIQNWGEAMRDDITDLVDLLESEEAYCD